ncbi:MAG: TraM recognition domain-containing protein, partial [Fibrobacter sp.]|nr:TraM recognition domain-containing protein [Fibrobacter sp.]
AFYIFDEINTYASSALIDLINKSRSANITSILATQSLSDLDFTCNEAFKEQVIENTNNYIVLRQNSAVNSEHWASILGTRATIDVTYQLQQQGAFETSETGLGSARRVREFYYHPDDIKTLQVGKGIFMSKDSFFHSYININKPF